MIVYNNMYLEITRYSSLPLMLGLVLIDLLIWSMVMIKESAFHYENVADNQSAQRVNLVHHRVQTKIDCAVLQNHILFVATETHNPIFCINHS